MITAGQIPRMKAALSLGLFVYLASFVFEGAIRYGLHMIGMEPLLYARDVILMLLLLATLTVSVSKDDCSLCIIVLLLLSSHILIATTYLSSYRQIFFGVKIFTPFLLGLFMYPILAHSFSRAKWIVFFFYLLIVSGIIVNHFYKYPWEGLVYYVDGVRINANLLWWDPDQKRRLAGFTRTSYDAALYCLLSGVYVFIFFRSGLLKALTWMGSAAAILMTTTKGIFLVYAVISLLFLCRFAAKSHSEWIRGFIWLPVALMIAIPLLSGIFLFEIDTSNPVQRYLFSSYIERLENTWPRALYMVGDLGDYLFGRGIGGIGTPQIFTEASFLNPADNMFIYLYVNFGLAGLVYLLSFAFRLNSVRFQDDEDIFLFCCALLILTYGITANILEGAVSSIMFGLTAGYLYESRITNARLRKKGVSGPEQIPRYGT